MLQNPAAKPLLGCSIAHSKRLLVYEIDGISHPFYTRESGHFEFVRSIFLKLAEAALD